jgi:hypothetical protein
MGTGERRAIAAQALPRGHGASPALTITPRARALTSCSSRSSASPSSCTTLQSAKSSAAGPGGRYIACGSPRTHTPTTTTTTTPAQHGWLSVERGCQLSGATLPEHGAAAATHHCALDRLQRRPAAAHAAPDVCNARAAQRSSCASGRARVASRHEAAPAMRGGGCRHSVWADVWIGRQPTHAKTHRGGRCSASRTAARRRRPMVVPTPVPAPEAAPGAGAGRSSVERGCQLSAVVS